MDSNWFEHMYCFRYVRSQGGKEKRKKRMSQAKFLSKMQDIQGNDDYASDDATNEVDFIGLFSCN